MESEYRYACHTCGIAKPRPAYRTQHKFRRGHGPVCNDCLHARKKELDAKKPKPVTAKSKPPRIVAGFQILREDKRFKGRPGKPLAVVRTPDRYAETRGNQP